ncbi:MAG: hypothetical protein JW797_13985 [Bradymonadales bacterium]|nr:hypothetical protein [Bradymonadales bacterium]
MAALGIGEILLILLMGGLAPNDLEPLAANQALQYMPAQCEAMAFADLRGAETTLNGWLEMIRGQTWLMSQPEVAAKVAEFSQMLAMAHTQAPLMLGFDPFTQLSSLSACVRLGRTAEGMPRPEFLVVIQGSFEPSAAGMLAGQIGLLQQTQVPTGQIVYGVTEGEMMVSLTAIAPGVLLLGTKALVDPLLATGGSPPVQAITPGSLGGRVTELMMGGAHSFFGFQPGPELRAMMVGEMPASLAELVSGMGRAVVVTRPGAFTFEVTALTAPIQHRYELLLEGIKEYILAFNHGLRAFLWGGAGLLSPNDPELDPLLRSMLANREEILTFVEGQLMSADPEVLMLSDPLTLTTTLNVNGPAIWQSLSGTMMLGGMFAFLSARSDVPPPYPAPNSPPPPNP